MKNLMKWTCVGIVLFATGTEAVAEDSFTVKATLCRVQAVRDENGNYREPPVSFRAKSVQIREITFGSESRMERLDPTRGEDDGTPPMTFDSATFTIGDATVRLTDDGVEIDKGTSSNLDVVAQPTVITLAGEPATISIGGTSPQYFTRNDDGTYSLHTLDESLGFSLSVTTQGGGESGPISVDYALDVAYVAERDGVEGTTLDIGKPVIQHAKKEGAWTTAPSHWVAVGGLPTGGPETYLCFFQVNRNAAQ